MKYGMGWRRQRLDPRDKIYRMASAGYVDESKSINLMDLPAMQFPVYDQGQTSSCVANAVGRSIRYLLASQGEKFDPSRLFIYWNARTAIHMQTVDDGCEIRDAIKSVASIGSAPEGNWPFNLKKVCSKPSSLAFQSASKHVSLIYQSVPQRMSNMLSCLRHNIPIVIGTTVFNSWDVVGKDGKIPRPAPGDKPQGGHAILITGWDAEERRFIFANSWGKQWGNDGFGSLPADYVLDTDMSSDFWAIFLMKK